MMIAFGTSFLPATSGTVITAAVEDVDVHTVVVHPFPMPSRELRIEREQHAMASAAQDPTIRELLAGSFAVHPKFEYTPDVSYAYYYTWHSMRTIGDMGMAALAFDGGYIARASVDPQTGAVTEVLLAPRPAEMVPQLFSPEQLEALDIARSDPDVQALVWDKEVYARLVFWRADYLGTHSQCLMGQCAEVFLQVVNEPSELRVAVDLARDEVIAIFDNDWNYEFAGAPDLATNAAFIPPASVSHTYLDHNPIVQHDWDVSYTFSATDGIQLDGTYHKDSSGTNHRLLSKAKIPYVKVWYVFCGSGPSAPCFNDQLCSTSCTYCPSTGCDYHGPEVHTYTDGFELHAEYYIGCTPSTWSSTAYGCYKYEQEYSFYNDAGVGTLFPWLRIIGPGFYQQPFYGESRYYTPIFMDIDIAGACCDTPAQWTGSWSTISTEHSFNDASPYDGGFWKWRVADGTKNVRIDPFANDAAVWWVLRYEPVAEQLPSTFDNNAATNGQDDMYYYTARNDNCRPAAQCNPGPTIQTNW